MTLSRVAALLGVLMTATFMLAEPAGAVPSRAPVVAAEPAFTVGGTNTIGWTWGLGWHTSWSGKPVKDHGFLVTATDVATGAQEAVAITTAYSAEPSVFSTTFAGLLDGHTYRFVVAARERHCNEYILYPRRRCVDWGSLIGGPPSNEVVSTQDATQPSGSLLLAGGAQFTASRLVTAGLNAADPPGGEAASGVGYVHLSEDGAFPCPSVCAVPFATQLQIELSDGPDGPRTVYVRLHDRALGPAASPVPSQFGTPAGNASATLIDAIVLDTTGPKLVVKQSASPALMGSPVSFDASTSDDGMGSGVDAATAVWDFGDGSKASGLAVTHVYATAGAFKASLTMRDRVGNESRLELPVTVDPVSRGEPSTNTGKPQPKPGEQVDRLAPVLSGARLKRAVLVVRLSEPATLLVDVRRARPAAVLASFRRPGKAGLNRIQLPSRVARALARPGRYRIVIGARDAAGNVSPATTLRLRRSR